jgi:hypothetical protein
VTGPDENTHVFGFCEFGDDRVKYRFSTILLSALLSLAAAQASAEGFRCGVHIVDEGKQMFEVEDACGAPIQVTRSNIQRPAVIWIHGRPYNDGTWVDVAVETWVYNFGSARLMQQLRFENGVLVDVESLDRGYDPQFQ